jgi:hypothetical protein
MFRIRLSVEVQELIGYQNRDLTKELFTKIITGESVYGDMEAQSRWPAQGVHYTGIYDLATNTWINNLDINEIDDAYIRLSRENWA